MLEGTALDAALGGIRAQLERMERVAGRIAQTTPEGDLASDLVELRLAQRGAEANLKVIQVADETLGTLLDIVR